MSAEATTATDGLLLAQEVGRELIEAHKRIRELQTQLEETNRDLDLAHAKIDELRQRFAGQA